MKKTLSILLITALLFPCSQLQALRIPSRAAAGEKQAFLQSGGAAQAGGLTMAVKVTIITAYTALTLMGIAKLTDKDKDNDWLGYLYLAPAASHLVFYFILDEGNAEI